jgi:hypothetical protein
MPAENCGSPRQQAPIWNGASRCGREGPVAAGPRASAQTDVIYLLTDGVFSPASTGDELNTRGVSIHTFCIGDAAGERSSRQSPSRTTAVPVFVP